MSELEERKAMIEWNLLRLQCAILQARSGGSLDVLEEVSEDGNRGIVSRLER